MDPDSKSRDLITAFDLLCKAHVFHKCVHSNSKSLTLDADSDAKVFKAYFLDVGLLLTRLQFSEVTFNIQADSAIKGDIFEQFVAQMLAYARGPFYPPDLFYWLRDKKSTNAEIDFLIQKNGLIAPIEVKNQSLNHMKSLATYNDEIKPKLNLNFYLGQPETIHWASHKTNPSANTKLLRLPIYLAERVYSFLA